MEADVRGLVRRTADAVCHGCLLLASCLGCLLDPVSQMWSVPQTWPCLLSATLTLVPHYPTTPAAGRGQVHWFKSIIAKLDVQSPPFQLSRLLSLHPYSQPLQLDEGKCLMEGAGRIFKFWVRDR